MQVKYKINNNFEILSCNDVNILIPNGKNEDGFILNETSKLLFDELSAPLTVEEIANILTKKYSIDEKTAKEDITEFLEEMIKISVISIV